MCCRLSSHRQKTWILQNSYCLAPVNKGLPQDITESPPTGCRNKGLAGHVETVHETTSCKCCHLAGNHSTIDLIAVTLPWVQNTCVDRMLNGNASSQYES